jgi:O-antigen/teichoic acid export membrane protein
MADSTPDNRAVAKAYALLFVGVMMPVLVFLAWRMALVFDPFTMTFFAKNRPEPTPDLPGQMRTIGMVIVGLGALVSVSTLQSIFTGVNRWKPAAVVVLMGLEIVAFGCAFFVAADNADIRIQRELAE